MKLDFYKQLINQKLFNNIKLSFFKNLKEKLVNLTYKYSILENPNLVKKPDCYDVKIRLNIF